MDNRDGLFQPESVNEQIEQLLFSQDPVQQRSIPGARTVAELQDVYRENASILENAWTRIADHTTPQQGTGTPVQITGYQETPRRQKRTHAAGTPLSLPQSRPRHRRRVLELSLVAAVILTTIIGWGFFLQSFYRTPYEGRPLASTPLLTPISTPDPHRGRPSCSVHLPTLLITNIDWSTPGKIAAGSWQPNVTIFDGATCQHVVTYPLFASGMVQASVAWSPDGQFLAASRSEVEILDGSTGKLLTTYHPWLSTATQAANSLATPLTTVGNTISAPLAGESGPGPGSTLTVISSSWSPDGKYIASAVLDPDMTFSVQIWDTSTGQHLRTISPSHYTGNVNLPVTWSPDGRYLAIAGTDSATLSIWNTSTWQIVSAFPYHARLGWIAWSPDSQAVAVSSYANSNGRAGVRIWSRVTNRVTLAFLLQQQSSGIITWSPDGRYITTEDKDIHLWDARTGHLVFIYQYNAPADSAVDTIRWLAWSPTRTMFAGLVLERKKNSTDENQDQSVISIWNVN